MTFNRRNKNSNIMKAIIYVGIGLFSVATVYGVADYYSSHKKGTLDKLYAEEETPIIAKVDGKTTTELPVKNIANEVVENKTATTKLNPKKNAKHARKEIKFEDFSRARIPEPVIIEEIKPEPVKKQEEIIPEKPAPAPIEKLSERKLSLDMYSRAPLKRPVKLVKKD